MGFYLPTENENVFEIDRMAEGGLRGTHAGWGREKVHLEERARRFGRARFLSGEIVSSTNQCVLVTSRTWPC